MELLTNRRGGIRPPLTEIMTKKLQLKRADPAPTKQQNGYPIRNTKHLPQKQAKNSFDRLRRSLGHFHAYRFVGCWKWIDKRNEKQF